MNDWLNYKGSNSARSDINWDTFESMINEINNNSKTNFRPRR